MNAYDYLIVGGGMTANAAVQGIRERDKKGTIAVFSDEADPPYSRPPLSKGLWSGKKEVDEIDCGTMDHKVDLMLEHTVTRINAADHCVTDNKSQVYGYNKLLLATGGSPRRLPFADDSIIYYRTLADYRRLSKELDAKQAFAVVGGGFIGCEIAAALAGNDKTVTMVFPEDALGAGLLPGELAKKVSRYYQDKGVSLMAGLKLSDVDFSGGDMVVHLENGRMLETDGVVAGIGIVPNTKLAEEVGLNVDDGIVVDLQLRTSNDAIYAAGDVANFHNPMLDRRMRVEHEDNALTMGTMAGRNMAGAEEEYTHLPFFYSDLFDVGYEAVGELDASLETVGVSGGLKEPGVWAYVRDGQVCGALLWNLFGQVGAARKLIGSGERFPPDELKTRLESILAAAGND